MLHKCSYCEFILLQLKPGKIMYLPSHVPDIFQNIQIKLSLKISRTYKVGFTVVVGFVQISNL